LNILKEVFMDPLRQASGTSKQILTADKIGVIFSNIEFIRSINGELCNKLSERIKDWKASQQLGDVFEEMV
jgi:hypothetical protein